MSCLGVENSESQSYTDLFSGSLVVEPGDKRGQPKRDTMWLDIETNKWKFNGFSKLDEKAIEFLENLESENNS